MNRQELPRIRLKVATNAGINILCTALRTWKVVQWLPHIEQAYRQVKEDQEGDEDSKRRFIKAIRIKKGNFYIANSQLIGDIFQDNDEVQCEISFPAVTKSKKERKIQKKGKKQGKIQQEDDEAQHNQQHKEQDIQQKYNNQAIEPKGSQSPKKKNKKQSQKQAQQQIQQQKKSLKEKKQSKKKQKNAQSNKKSHQKSQIQQTLKSFQKKLIKKVDFSKLKQLLNTKNDSKISQPRQSDVKIQVQSSESQSSQQEQI